MARPRTAISDIKLRLREPLRQKIEDAAAANGVSMNSEMVSRLEESFAEQNALYSALGTVETFTVMRALGLVAASISEVTDENWLEDKAVYDKCRNAFDAILDGMAPRGGKGKRVAPGLGQADAIAVLERYVRDLKERWGIDPGVDVPADNAAAERIYNFRRGK